ncbi:hypothetical protein P3S68_003157 [Capsicum galapagoense]
MLNSNIFFSSCSVSLRWLVCGFLDGPPYHTKFKEGLVVSNKDKESGIMDETKSQKIEILKEENLRQRQQMMEMYRAWASGLPPPQFSTFDPANTLSLPLKSQSRFPTMVNAPYESTFTTLDDHCYTLEPTVQLSGPPKFLTKKPRMLEELQKVVGKVKSVENDMKNSPGLMGYEDVSYKN